MNSISPANQKMFSIIMATYNCGQKVENTLKSIFSQNRDLFELIVFDGASTDETLDYIKRYESDLTLVSEKDDGVYDAFNKGIARATGKYLYFIGSGDCLHPGILEKVKEFLPLENPALVYGQCYFVKQKMLNGRKFKNLDFTFTNLCHQGMFYHRKIFELIGYYDPRYKVFSDWFFNLKCFLRQEITKLFIPLVIADYEGGGLSAHVSNDPAFNRDFPQFVKKELGIPSYIISRSLMANPDVFYFIYSLGFKTFGLLISIARPPVRAYRKLKQNIRPAK